MRCPICGREFDDHLHLKSKDDVYLCMEHGLFSYHNGELVPTKYPCPKCRGNYKAPKYHDGTWAVCECEIHGEWRVSFLRSFKFRKLCSIAASKPTKSPEYYTPPEMKVKEILDRLGLKYDHNRRFRDEEHNTYYYPDFIVYLNPTSLVIGVSPSIWHERWNRAESERRKKEYFRKLGYTFIDLTEKNEREWEHIIRKTIEDIKRKEDKEVK